MNEDFEIFEGKSFKGLCKDIYDRSEHKKDQIDILISELRPLVRNVDDAIQVVPQIRGYLDVSVKNDEQLVKLAAIIQRLQTVKIEKGGGELLTDAEKEELWKEVKEVSQEIQKPVTQTTGSLI
jgi:hypothetical protein